MASDSDFLNKAVKFVESWERLNRLRSDGKVKKDVFLKHRGRLEHMLTVLKEENIRLLKKFIFEIDRALERVEADRKINVIGEDRYLSIRRELRMQREDIESEKDSIELCGGDEYVSCLKRQIESNKYERYMAPHVDAGRVLRVGSAVAGGEVGVAGEYDVPIWVWAAVALFPVLAFILGSRYGSLPPLSYFLGGLAGTAAGVVILHASTMAAAVETASVRRALACLTVGALLLAVSGSAVTVLMSRLYAAFSGSLDTPTVGLTIMWASILSAGVLVLALPMWCVKNIYDATDSQAAITVIINHVIWFVAASVLRAVGVL